MAGGAQQANEGVAEDRVAQVADVRGLVGIDAGVLDEDLAADVGGSFAFMELVAGFVPIASAFAAASRSGAR